MNKRNQFNNFTLDEFNELVKDNPNITSTDLADYLGRTIRATKDKLSKWKARKCLKYDIIKNEYCNFIVNQEKLKGSYINEKISQEITDYKVKAYVIQVKVTRRLIDNPNLKPTDILKAIDLQQKALRYIDNDRAYNIIKEIEGEDFFSNKDSIGVVE